MLDLRYIREHPDEVRAGVAKKRGDVSLVDAALDADRARREALREVERLRAEQNRASAEIPRLAGEERQRRIEAMREVSAHLKQLEPQLREAEERLTDALLRLPNLPHPSVPEGATEADNVPVRTWGEPPTFPFEALDHVEIGRRLDILDFDRAARVAGTRFYYLTREAVLLELALVRYALDVLIGEGFVPVYVPMMVRPEIWTGWNGGAAVDEQMTYAIKQDDLVLIGTAEGPLVGRHAGETLDDLPLRLAGISACFRREAGTYGRESRGLYRVHQFDKVEMVVLCRREESWAWHERMLAIEEAIVRSLGLAYRVVNICGGDLGDAAAKKYDVEAWMPGRGGYGETHSCSNTTDFQARRLGIRYRANGGTEYVHTLNGTAIATTRAIQAILENFQERGGSVEIPEVLRPYMGGIERIGPR